MQSPAFTNEDIHLVPLPLAMTQVSIRQGYQDGWGWGSWSVKSD